MLCSTTVCRNDRKISTTVVSKKLHGHCDGSTQTTARLRKKQNMCAMRVRCIDFFPKAYRRVPVYSWGSGGWTCVRVVFVVSSWCRRGLVVASSWPRRGLVVVNSLIPCQAGKLSEVFSVVFCFCALRRQSPCHGCAKWLQLVFFQRVLVHFVWQAQ